MNRRGSAVKWVLVVVLLGAAVALLVWRLGGGSKAKAVPLMLACENCPFRGQVDLPANFSEWPATCPKCQKRSALPAFPCPACGQLYPRNPEKPPTACPSCKAPLGDED